MTLIIVQKYHNLLKQYILKCYICWISINFSYVIGIKLNKINYTQCQSALSVTFQFFPRVRKFEKNLSSWQLLGQANSVLQPIVNFIISEEIMKWYSTSVLEFSCYSWFNCFNRIIVDLRPYIGCTVASRITHLMGQCWTCVNQSF